MGKVAINQHNSSLQSKNKPTKMSSNTETALSSILSLLQKMDTRISSLESSKSSAASGAGKVTKKAAKAAKKEAASASASAEEKKERAPTAWRLFADRVRALLRENGYEGRALGPECVQFASSLKEENADFSSWSDSDILARREAWSAPEISKGELKGGKGWAKTGERRAASKNGSVVSGADGEEAEEGSEKPKKARKNPWEGLSPEEKAERIAKMKAGKAAKKAASEGLLDDEPLGASAEEIKATAAKMAAVKAKSEEAPPKVSAPPKAVSASPKAVSEAPKSSAAAGGGAAAAAASSSSSSASAAASAFKPVLLTGTRYLVNMESGHAYFRNEDGSQGEWAGIFSRTPKPHVDTSVPEPGAEEEGEEEEVFE